MIFSLLLITITIQPENKIVYLNESDSQSDEKLKSEFCKLAWSSFKAGKISERLFHPETKSYLESNETEDLSMKGIKEVYTKMVSKDVCKVIFKREKGFSGVNSVFANEGEFGLQVSAIIAIKKLTVEDVEDYL